jgi:hypothetical protein
MPREKGPAYLRRWRQYGSPQKKLLRSHPNFGELINIQRVVEIL